MKRKFKPEFDHIGVVVADMESGLDFLSKLLDVKLPPASSPLGKLFKVVDWEEGGLRWAQIPVDTPERTLIELLEPRTESNLKYFLRTSGNMAVAEICFRVDDIERFYDRAKELGMTPVDFFGKPLVGQKFFSIPLPEVPEDSPAKCFYLGLPLKPGHGPAIEIAEYPDAWWDAIQKLTQQR